MKKQALFLGLMAVFYALPVTWFIQLISALLHFNFPWLLMDLLGFGAAALLAWKFLPLVEGEDIPPFGLTLLLRVTAGYYLLVKILWPLVGLAGIGGIFGPLLGISEWALVIAALTTARFLKPRLMLFVGLTAFALQFKAADLLVFLSFPEWARFLVTLAIAILVARPFCVGTASAADRVTNPRLLWFFSAAGLLSAMMTGGSIWLRSTVQMLVWLTFLVSFVLLARNAAGGDHDPASSSPVGKIFLVFVSLLMVVATVFHGQDITLGRLSYSLSERLHAWLPFVVSGAIAIGIMKFLRVGRLVPADGPGYRLMFWGVILFLVPVLSGLGLFSTIARADQTGQLIMAVIWLALLAAPLLAVAQLLFGIGLLRRLFTTTS